MNKIKQQNTMYVKRRTGNLLTTPFGRMHVSYNRFNAYTVPMKRCSILCRGKKLQQQLTFTTIKISKKYSRIVLGPSCSGNVSLRREYI